MSEGGGERAGIAPRQLLVAAAPILVVGLLALDDGGFDLLTRQRLALFVCWALALALAFGFAPRAAPPRGWGLVAAGLTALAGWQLYSVAWGPSDERAVAETARTLAYLGVLAAAWTALGPRSWRWAAIGIFIVAAAITAYAVIGRLIPSAARLDEVERSLATDRLFAPLGYWNALAAWAAMTLAMALAWSADSRRGWLRSLTAALIPLSVVAVYLTYSRGGVVGATVGIALVLGLTRNRPRAAIHAVVGGASAAVAIFAVRSEPAIANGTGGEGAAGVAIVLAMAMAVCWVVASWTRALGSQRGAGAVPARATRLSVAAIGLLALALVAVALIGGRGGFGRGGDSAAFDTGDPSARLTTAAGNRSAYWSEAIDAFSESPLRGEGAGSFPYRWASSGSDPELVADAHSIVFETAAELGLVGLACIVAIAAGLLRSALRGLAAASRNASATGLVAAFGVYLFAGAIDWMWELTAVSYLGLGCAGVVAMAASSPLRAPRLRGRVRWGLVAAAIVAGAVQVPGIVSTQLVRESAEHRLVGASKAAITAATDAIAAAPWSASAYAARAEAEMGAGLLAGAQADAGEAIEREPREAGHRILAALVAGEQGDLAEAEAELNVAVKLSPHDRRLQSAEVRGLVVEIVRSHAADGGSKEVGSSD